MALRCQYESCNDVGVFTKLTNSYCLVGLGSATNYYSTVQNHLQEVIPVVNATIADCRIVGSMVAGNKHGLIVPESTTDTELQHLRNSLPDTVVVQRVKERLSALGNIISCNDHVGLLHPQIDSETEEIIRDTLKIETFRQTIANHTLVGQYCVMNNKGALVHPSTQQPDMDELAAILQVAVAAGSVNRGSNNLAAGIVVNDWQAFCGHTTTGPEMQVLESVFQLTDKPSDMASKELRDSILVSMS